MKILIISDTHGHHNNLEEVLGRMGGLDMLIHLGDSESGEEYISALVECPVVMVAGNNDFFSALEKEQEFMIKQYRVLATHGHYYQVSLSPERIRREAIRRGVDIVMYGHTHRPFIQVKGGLMMINPGSLSFPRQDGRKGSFVIMEIDADGEVHFTLDYV